MKTIIIIKQMVYGLEQTWLKIPASTSTVGLEELCQQICQEIEVKTNKLAVTTLDTSGNSLIKAIEGSFTRDEIVTVLTALHYRYTVQYVESEIAPISNFGVQFSEKKISISYPDYLTRMQVNNLLDALTDAEVLRGYSAELCPNDMNTIIIAKLVENPKQLSWHILNFLDSKNLLYSVTSKTNHTSPDMREKKPKPKTHCCIS
jgi:hypothetical protein